MKNKYCEMDYEAIGIRIAKYRKNIRLNQEQLAEKVGCSRNAIQKVEKNTMTPSLELICAIASALDITPNSILLGSYHVDNRSERVLQKVQLMDEERFELYLDIADSFIDKSKGEA